MPKRTLSDSISASQPDAPGPVTSETLQSEHSVAKFRRLSPSPPDPDERSPDDSAAPPRMLEATQTRPPIQCALPPHPPLFFDCLTAFEAHLYSHHTNRCSSCGANLPTAHLLEIHATEMHDPIAAARRDRGEGVFVCLVPGCEKICQDRWKRRRHVIDKHHWRKDYDWNIVERGIDGRGSVLKAEAKKHSRGKARRASLMGELQDQGGKRNAGFPTREDTSINTVSGEIEQSLVGLSEPDYKQVEEAKINIDIEQGHSAKSLNTSDEVVSGSPNETPGRMERSQRPEASNAEPAVNELTSALSALRFVPPSVIRNQKCRPEGC